MIDKIRKFANECTLLVKSAESTEPFRPINRVYQDEVSEMPESPAWVPRASNRGTRAFSLDVDYDDFEQTRQQFKNAMSEFSCRNEALIESEVALYMKKQYGIEAHRISDEGKVVLNSDELSTLTQLAPLYMFLIHHDTGTVEYTKNNEPVITFTHIHDPVKQTEVIRHWEL